MSLVSIVVPLFNEAEAFWALADALEELSRSLWLSGYDSELILVDDGSSDSTWLAMQSFAYQNPDVVALRLSRNFGHQFALTAGYDYAKGDAVVCLDADLQDPPEVVEEMVRQWEAGFDIVYGVREKREGETWFKRATAALFYRLMTALGAPVRESSGDFRLMSRRALDALNSYRERHRLVRGLVGLVGFKETEVRYVRRARVAGETKYPFRRMLALAADSILSFSSFPLRVAYISAFSIMGGVFGYVGYSFIRVAFFGAELVLGWTSTLLAICAFGAANLIALGLLGEYVGRIFEQVKERPLYLVREVTKHDSRV